VLSRLTDDGKGVNRAEQNRCVLHQDAENVTEGSDSEAKAGNHSQQANETHEAEEADGCGNRAVGRVRHVNHSPHHCGHHQYGVDTADEPLSPVCARSKHEELHHDLKLQVLRTVSENRSHAGAGSCTFELWISAWTVACKFSS